MHIIIIIYKLNFILLIQNLYDDFQLNDKPTYKQSNNTYYNGNNKIYLLIKTSIHYHFHFHLYPFLVLGRLFFFII